MTTTSVIDKPVTPVIDSEPQLRVPHNEKNCPMPTQQVEDFYIELRHLAGHCTWVVSSKSGRHGSYPIRECRLCRTFQIQMPSGHWVKKVTGNIYPSSPSNSFRRTHGVGKWAGSG